MVDIQGAATTRAAVVKVEQNSPLEFPGSLRLCCLFQE